MTGFLDRMAARAAGTEHVVQLPAASRYAPPTTIVEVDDRDLDVDVPTPPSLRPVGRRAREPEPAREPSADVPTSAALGPAGPTITATEPVQPALDLSSDPAAGEPAGGPPRITTPSPDPRSTAEAGAVIIRPAPAAAARRGVTQRPTSRPAASPTAPRPPGRTAAPATPPRTAAPPVADTLADHPEQGAAIPADLIGAHVLPELVGQGLVSADAELVGDGEAPADDQQSPRRPRVRVGQIRERTIGRPGIEVRIDRIEIVPAAPPAPPPAAHPAPPAGPAYELPVVDHAAYLARRKAGR